MRTVTNTMCCMVLAVACIMVPGAAAGESGGSFDPCLQVTAAQAAAILEVEADDIDMTHGSEMLPNLCTAVSRSDWMKRLSFSSYRFASAREAAAELAVIREGLANLSTIEIIEGLGDEAFYAPDDRVQRLVVRKNELLLDVMPCGDRTKQQKIAEIMMAH